MRSVLALVSLLVLVSLAGSASVSTAARNSETPVPSLEPAATEKLWRELVTSKPLRTQAAECRPLRAVFYAASDWLRLATKLAATASPCADYHVSVPPLVADKTTFRRDQASRIRALVPRLPAMAEIHFATWSRWVAAPILLDPGVTHGTSRAGYDVTRGQLDLNGSLCGAPRRRNARTNVRELLRGLYEATGRAHPRLRPRDRFGQRTSDLSVYRTRCRAARRLGVLDEIATYVATVAGGVRRPRLRRDRLADTDRREYLNDYLQHKLVLATAGPSEVEPARAFLRETYSPLANGAWPRDTAWGWTMVPAEQMAAYLAAQVNALRSFSATSAQPRDHWGFAWAPRNRRTLHADFAAQTACSSTARVSRYATRATSSIRRTLDGACGRRDALRRRSRGARHNGAWRSFRTWAQSTLTMALPHRPLPAGAVSPPLQLLSVGCHAPAVVTLRSSSPREPSRGPAGRGRARSSSRCRPARASSSTTKTRVRARRR